MAKKRNDYFEMIKHQVSYSVKASNLLEEILCKYDAESINAYRGQMHRIEHEGRGRRGRHLPHQIAREHLQIFLNPVAQRVRLGRGLRLLSKVEFLRAHADEED